jgi:SpoVK/Ycf46/Vps4 family AAA+-type ATPase
MRSEGFADDGLFPRIREFFLPLTISEQELHLERSSNQGVRLTMCKQLHRKIELYTAKLNETKDANQKCNEETLRMEQTIKDHEAEYSQLLTTWKSKKNNKKQQKQLEVLHQTYQDCLKRQDNFLKQRHKLKQEKEIITKRINEWQNKIDGTKDRLQKIEKELNTPHKPVEKQLVKPPRGLIMYGPPGTGKSDILSKLAKKLGIIMVGPPLAAGELNRPLVGESERILIALCSRCYQVPYAMCCVSIDEIDSLAPKRDEDSSEGKVDKISVLLSLIEGIKDVPNLMILSATNRLHMMDEAFLRRMSGKFFVGRPSPDARLSMLRTIPCWALEPELLDRLAMATTNFSGAAVK